MPPFAPAPARRPAAACGLPHAPCPRAAPRRPAPRRRRKAAAVPVAHGDHSECGIGCGGGHKAHGGGASLSPAERGTRALATRLGLSGLAASVDHSLPALAAGAACLGVAAACASPPAALARVAAPATLAAASAVAVAAAYALAGAPDMLDLVHSAAAALPRPLGAGLGAAAARVDTHALMAASAAAAAAVGAPLEGALLLLLFGASHALEDRLAAAARGDLASLRAAAPATALRLPPWELREGGPPTPDLASFARAPADDIAVGDLVLVRPGDGLPVDGVVVWGTALVTAAHITGESLPRRATVGDALPAGALARDGPLAVAATAVAAASAPARVAAAAAAAQAARPALTAWLDVAGAAYAKAALLAAAAAFVGLVVAGVPVAGSVAAPRGALYRSLALLTAASPCALALAPLAYVAGVAAAARRGALLRGGGVLDALATVRAVALDKTGTLTRGQLTCVGLADPGDWAPGTGRVRAGGLRAPAGRALALGAALALRTAHPVADALSAAAVMAGVPPAKDELASFEAVPGRGARATTPDGRTLLLGAADWVADELPPTAASNARATAAALAAGGRAVSLVAELPPAGSDADPLVRAFAFEDGVRAASRSAVAQLRAAGLVVRMLTGDNAASALATATALGLSPADVEAGLDPDGKVEALRRLKASVGCGGVLMVGDGVNDAPALATADVGAALAASPGAGGAAAVADVLLLGGAGVEALPGVLAIARSARSAARANLALAALSAAALAPFCVSGSLPLWAAVALHEGSTLAVALNSLRPLGAGGRRGGQPEGAAAAAAPVEGVAAPAAAAAA